MPNGAFNICCPRDCVSRHNGGTSGAPLKPLRDDSALTATSSGGQLCIMCFDYPGIETMSRIIRVIFQNSLYRNKNREEVRNRENYPTHRLYLEEVETPQSS